MTSMVEVSRHSFALRGKRVWVAGHAGMVGSALVRRLKQEECRLITVDHAELDLTRQRETEEWMAVARPDVVFIAAARVGGILANAHHPADFLYENTMIAMNIMHAAHRLDVEKLLWLGSSCIYPKYADQPIEERALLTGNLEPTNEAYAIAKIAGLKLAEAYARQYGQCFITAMPTNLYGQNDNFDLQQSHVLPALIRKMHEARETGNARAIVWGTGTPRREFLHVDDLADACVFLMKNHASASHVNIGSGAEISIRDLALLIARIVDYRGCVDFDTSKPDGAPRKLLDCSQMEAMGWRPRIELEAGIRDLYSRWQASSASSQGLVQAG